MRFSRIAVSAGLFLFITPSLAQGQQEGVHERLERSERTPSALEGTVGTTDPSLAYYFVLIQDKITSNWNPPKIGLGVAATINLSANVLRSGQVLGLTIKSSSGDRLLDDSALRAASLSTPLPPLPPLFKAETLLLELQFTARSNTTTGQIMTHVEVGLATAQIKENITIAKAARDRQEKPGGEPDIFERRSINDQLHSEQQARYQRFLNRYKGKKLWVAPGHLRGAYMDFYEKPDSLSPHLKEGTVVRWMLIKRAHYKNVFDAWIEVVLDNGATAFVDGSMVGSSGDLGLIESLSFVDEDPEERARRIMGNLDKHLPGRRVSCLGTKLVRVCVGDAHFTHREHLDRSIVNTQIGHRERSDATLGVR